MALVASSNEAVGEVAIPPGVGVNVILSRLARRSVCKARRGSALSLGTCSGTHLAYHSERENTPAHMPSRKRSTGASAESPDVVRIELTLIGKG